MALKKIPYYKMVANYERRGDYLYKDFWKGREYEHMAEVNALRHILNKHVGQGRFNVLDLGGGFGRLVPILSMFFKEVVLGDYSIKEIKSGKDIWEDIPPGVCVHGIGLNAYRLPFRANTFDAVVSVRLMHHIKYPQKLFTEVYRVLKPGGVFVLEFAHKNHLKAVLRALARRDLGFFREDVYQQQHNPQSAQGIKGGGIIFFDNFSYGYVAGTLRKAGFSVIDSVPVSFLRVGFLKRKLGVGTLLKIENILQRFRWLRITPSVFVVARKEGGGMQRVSSSINNTKDSKAAQLAQECALQRLLCPKHRVQAIKKRRYVVCEKGCRYPIQDNILDLRYPPPTEVDF